jgi:hypothetical protein
MHKAWPISEVGLTISSRVSYFTHRTKMLDCMALIPAKARYQPNDFSRLNTLFLAELFTPAVVATYHQGSS